MVRIRLLLKTNIKKHDITSSKTTIIIDTQETIQLTNTMIQQDSLSIYSTFFDYF